MKSQEHKKQEIKDLIKARTEHQSIIQECLREISGRSGKQHQQEFKRLQARWRLDLMMESKILRLIDEL